jgi:hypothetical protein
METFGALKGSGGEPRSGHNDNEGSMRNFWENLIIDMCRPEVMARRRGLEHYCVRLKALYGWRNEDNIESLNFICQRREKGERERLAGWLEKGENPFSFGSRFAGRN